MSLQRNYQADNLFFFNKNVTRLAEKENMGNVVNAFIINKVFNRAICNSFIVKMEKYKQYDSRVMWIYNWLKDSKESFDEDC